MYTTLKNQTLAILILLSGVVACSKTTGTTTSEEPAADSTETTASTDSEWVYLFDGTSLDGWRAFNGDTLPQNWIIEDGTLKSSVDKSLGNVIFILFSKNSIISIT